MAQLHGKYDDDDHCHRVTTQLQLINIIIIIIIIIMNRHVNQSFEVDANGEYLLD